MPTIEIVSLDSEQLKIEQDSFGLAIIVEDELISHRGLFYEFLKKYHGTIFHIGNPEFKENNEKEFHGADLINWEFEFKDNFKFEEKYKSDFFKLLQIAIEKSPNNQAFFLTDIQANEPKPKYRNVKTIFDLIKLYDNEGLEWNTLYAINLPYLRNSLYSEVDWILWNDWDPIGVKSFDWPADEYCGYVPRIYKMLNDNNNELEIAKQLDFFVTDSMGLNSNLEKNIEIARLLIKKKNEYK